MCKLWKRPCRQRLCWLSKTTCHVVMLMLCWCYALMFCGCKGRFWVVASSIRNLYNIRACYHRCSCTEYTKYTILLTLESLILPKRNKNHHLWNIKLGQTVRTDKETRQWWWRVVIPAVFVWYIVMYVSECVTDGVTIKGQTCKHKTNMYILAKHTESRAEQWQSAEKMTTFCLVLQLARVCAHVCVWFIQVCKHCGLSGEGM